MSQLFVGFRDEITNIPLNSAISRQAKASKFSLVLWLHEIVEFHSTFPTLGRVSELSLLSLIGNVGLAAISNRKNV